MKKKEKAFGDQKAVNGRWKYGKLIWASIVIMVISGVAITICDYKTWKHAETDRFGQGWEDMSKPAMDLVTTHRLSKLGVRLSLPSGWNLTERAVPAAYGSEFAEVAAVEKIMKIKSAVKPGNLVDLVDGRAGELVSGGVLLEERAYIRKANLDLTVLQWSEDLSGGGAVIRQEVWGKSGDRVILIETAVDEADWPDLKKTVWAVYESLEMVY